MILPPDFEARTLDAVREIVADIPECANAELSVVSPMGVPQLRFAFGDPALHSRPMLMVNLLAQSRSNPLAPGRLVSAAQLQRHVREWVEEYFKIQGNPLSKVQHA